MKKVFFAAIAIACAGYTNAQTGTEAATAIGKVETTADDQQKTPIKVEDLPALVKKSLASEAYAEWTAESAFWIDGANPHYEINLTKGNNKTVAHLDKEGNTVKL